MSEENTPVEEEKAPVAELNTPVEEKKEEVKEEPLQILPSEMEAQLTKAYQRGANLLYSELIGYLFSACEVFAVKFKPENSPHHAFLGFVLQTLGEEFNKKYVTKEEAKDGKEDDGKPEAVQGEDGEGQEAPQERHEDVQGGACGGQEACEESKQEEKKEVSS